MTSPKALVLVSGGQDSATCLAIATDRYPGAVMAIGFDYAQRHRVELEQAQILSDLAGVPFSRLDLSLLSQLTHNALTRHDQTIVHEPGSLPSTFVPGRNHLFLSIAAIYAKQHDISLIYTGVCQTDFSGYPDCRDVFIKSLNVTLYLAMETQFQIETPLMWLTKAETVLKMKALERLDWYAHTHTCYEGKRPACGRCPACILRLKGFQEAGILDLIEYE